MLQKELLGEFLGKILKCSKTCIKIRCAGDEVSQVMRAYQASAFGNQIALEESLYGFMEQFNATESGA